MLVEELIADFVRHHAENSKPATARFYRQGLRWLGEDFGRYEWEKLDRIGLRDALHRSWHRYDGSAMSPATRRRNTVAVGQLQRHAIDQEFTARVILTKKDLAKPGSGRREVVPTAEELDRLTEEAAPAMGLVIRGMRACGMRPGELCRADVSMIEPRTGIVDSAN